MNTTPSRRQCFLKFNELYHLSLKSINNLLPQEQEILRIFKLRYQSIYALPLMPRLQETRDKGCKASEEYNLEEFEKVTRLFIDQLDACNLHIKGYHPLEKGKEGLKQDCINAIAYIRNIEYQVGCSQFLLNNDLIKTIKQNPTNFQRISLLLKEGASPNSRDVSTGDTALTLAIESANLDLLNLLLQYNPDPNLKRESISRFKPTQTPLLVVTQEIIFFNNKSPQIIDDILRLDTLKQIFFALLDHGANVNIPDEDGKTVKNLVPFLYQEYQNRKAAKNNLIFSIQ